MNYAPPLFTTYIPRFTLLEALLDVDSPGYKHATLEIVAVTGANNVNKEIHSKHDFKHFNGSLSFGKVFD